LIFKKSIGGSESFSLSELSESIGGSAALTSRADLDGIA